jgi:uncharacterized protein
MQNTIRNTVVDTLRGWALFIVVISNYLGFAYSTEGKIVGEGWLIDAIEFIEQHLFSAKGWTLLFTLFGSQSRKSSSFSGQTNAHFSNICFGEQSVV